MLCFPFPCIFSPLYYSDLPHNLFSLYCSVIVLFPLLFIYFFACVSFLFPKKRRMRSVKSDEQKGRESTAVKVIDKKREGSKTVIVRGKEFTKRAMEGSREKDELWEVFFTSCSHVTLDQREQVGGRRKERG